MQEKTKQKVAEGVEGKRRWRRGGCETESFGMPKVPKGSEGGEGGAEGRREICVPKVGEGRSGVGEGELRWRKKGWCKGEDKRGHCPLLKTMYV